MTESLSVWLNKGNKTDVELSYWISKYIMARGTIKFQDLGVASPEMKLLVEEKKLISWRNFMEGRISKRFVEIQSKHLVDIEGHLNDQDWTKGILSRLLQSTHGQ